jgi:hypothetical protein
MLAICVGAELNRSILILSKVPSDPFSLPSGCCWYAEIGISVPLSVAGEA